MEDVGIIAATTRTMSLAPSDSQDASEESTRASTPTENQIEEVPATIDSLEPFVQDDVADDVTTRDVDCEEKLSAGATDEFHNPKAISRPSSTVIDPGTSPWKAAKTEQEPVDYASDPQKLEELLRLRDADSPDLYNP